MLLPSYIFERGGGEKDIDSNKPSPITFENCVFTQLLIFPLAVCFIFASLLKGVLCWSVVFLNLCF